MKFKNTMRSLLKQKKGMLGLDTAKDFIVAILTIAVIAFAVIVALSSLKDSNAIKQTVPEYNQTQAILSNVSAGTASFFSNAGTWFSLLSVVIIILIIGVVIWAVNRFGARAESTGI